MKQSACADILRRKMRLSFCHRIHVYSLTRDRSRRKQAVPVNASRAARFNRMQLLVHAHLLAVGLTIHHFTAWSFMPS